MKIENSSRIRILLNELEQVKKKLSDIDFFEREKKNISKLIASGSDNVVIDINAKQAAIILNVIKKDFLEEQQKIEIELSGL
ncbi:MAG: hypothetical protein WC516_06670 [Patescibacteria group bacterium]